MVLCEELEENVQPSAGTPGTAWAECQEAKAEAGGASLLLLLLPVSREGTDTVGSNPNCVWLLSLYFICHKDKAIRTPAIVPD